MTQAELKEVYRQEVTEYWKRPNMIDYCMKNCAYLVELDDGDLYEIEKPSIKKDFCFGYGYCGVSTEEDYESAADSAQNARQNVNYFMEKNLEPINRMIEDIYSYSGSIYKRTHYCQAQPNAKLKGLVWVEFGAEPLEGWKKLSDREKKAIIEGYEEVKKAFTKRLNTYLKRYGLTKVNSWTYLSD